MGITNQIELKPALDTANANSWDAHIGICPLCGTAIRKKKKVNKHPFLWMLGAQGIIIREEIGSLGVKESSACRGAGVELMEGRKETQVEGSCSKRTPMKTTGQLDLGSISQWQKKHNGKCEFSFCAILLQIFSGNHMCALHLEAVETLSGPDYPRECAPSSCQTLEGPSTAENKQKKTV